MTAKYNMLINLDNLQVGIREMSVKAEAEILWSICQAEQWFFLSAHVLFAGETGGIRWCCMCYTLN